MALDNAAGPNLGDSFKRYFRMIPTLDDASERETYRIRHDVYCSDLGWEAQREDGMETDGYDRHSVSCLMRTADERDRRVGCMRLVLARPEDPAFPLPLEVSCANAIDRRLLDPAKLDRSHIAEVSRLAVVKEFRRRADEATKPIAVADQDFHSDGATRFPYIPFGLYLSAFAIADHLHIEHLLVLTEPRLAEHFKKVGFQIQQIGEAIEHRGKRIPSVMHTQTVIRHLPAQMYSMWETVRLAIEESFSRTRVETLPLKWQPAP